MDSNDLRSYRILRKFKVISLVNGMLILKDSGFKGVAKKIEQKRNRKSSDLTFKNISFDKGKIVVVIDKNIDVKSIAEQLDNKKLKFQLFQIADTFEQGKITKITYDDLKKYFVFKSFVMISNSKRHLEELYFPIVISNSNSIYEKIEEMLSDINGMKLVANYNNKNNINVKASTFFDYEGTNYYSGGAERYLVDLHEVCNKLNCNLDIYQNANKPYFRKFSNINVIGLPLKDLKVNYNEQFIRMQADNYIYATRNAGQLNIYSAFHECYPRCAHPAIGISHGVSWDNKSCHAYDGINFWQNKKMFIESAQMCDRLISVDTNTANWFQTIDFEIGNQKFNVIPNYVDTKEFSPHKDYLKKRDKIVITYPRRLYEARGLYLALETANKILKKYDNVEFHFVGKGFDDDLKQIAKYQKKWPNKILCYSKSPFEMHQVYKDADISLIPTLYSEGTSLSCLEALASGNIVISSRIGGLTDLIINGYNGYLIEPTVDAFCSTIENIIENYDDMSVIRKRALETAEIFNKSVWKERWTKILQEFDLNTKDSTNIDLVEFHLNSINDITSDIVKLIRKELENNCLVYLRLKKLPENDCYTANRFQIVSDADEVVSKPVRVYSCVKNDKKVDCDELIKL